MGLADLPCFGAKELPWGKNLVLATPPNVAKFDGCGSADTAALGYVDTGALPTRIFRRSTEPTAVGWAELLWRTFGVFGAACPTCGAVMRLRAVVWPPATLDVLASLRRSARGPPPGSAASGA